MNPNKINFKLKSSIFAPAFRMRKKRRKKMRLHTLENPLRRWWNVESVECWKAPTLTELTFRSGRSSPPRSGPTLPAISGKINKIIGNWFRENYFR